METLESFIAQFCANPNYELEMALHPKSGHLSLSFERFEILKNVMIESAAKQLYQQLPQDEFTDYFYENSLRLRCRDAGQKTEVVRKTPVSKIIAVCPTRDFAAHFHLKNEQPIVDYSFLKTQTPINVRGQIVMTWLYKDAFAYSLKTVWEGPTKVLAASQLEKYEFELELLHNKAYLASKPTTQHAVSFVEKTLDLCGRYNANRNNIPEKLILTFLTGNAVTPDLKGTLQTPKTKGRKKRAVEVPLSLETDCNIDHFIKQTKVGRKKTNKRVACLEKTDKPKKVPSQTK